jgi:hypothetical protein
MLLILDVHVVDFGCLYRVWELIGDGNRYFYLIHN